MTISYSKHFVLFFAAQLLVHFVFAQSFFIVGRVTDSIAGAPLPGATIAAYKSGHLQAQTLASGTGDFQLEVKIQQGIVLVVSHQGFIAHRRIINLVPGTTSVGDIALAQTSSSLGDVTVLSRRKNQAFRTDRQIFNASQFAQASSGNAVDVIRNLPGVSANSFGELSLRGSSSFLLMINGKPVQGDVLLVLNQLSADAIAQVEISTNPGATVDAEGKSGVVNIITKTAVQDGWMLQGNGMYGLPPLRDYENHRNPKRYGADLSLGYRKNNWDLSGGLNALRNDIAGNRSGDVFTVIHNVRTSFPSYGERSFQRYNYGGRFTVKYGLNKSSDISLGIYHGYRFQSRVADLQYTVTKANASSGNIFSNGRFFNANDQRRNGKFSLAALDYKTQVVNTSITISSLFERANLYGITSNVNLTARTFADTLQYTLNPYTNPLNAFRLKADAETAMKALKLQYGYQLRFDKQQGDFLYQTAVTANGWELSREFSGTLRTRNTIHAIYAQLSKQWSRTFISAGLRSEHLNRQLSFNNGETNTELKLANLFPSATVRFNTSENGVLKLSYTRRVKRNSNFELNPLPEREHSETLEQGDPNLLPELSGNTELGIEQSFGNKGSFFIAAYHQQIKNPIQRVNKVYNDTILNRIFTNAGKASQWGLETNLIYNITSWWSSGIGGNIYHYALKGTLFGGDVNVHNSNWVYSLNANQTFTLGKNWMTQFALNYLSQRVTAQGEDSRFFTPHFTVRKTSSNKRFSFQLQWLNISAGLFKSNEQRITTYGRNFFTTTNYLYETDQLQFAIAVNLSKLNRKFALPQSEIGEKEF